MSEAADVLVVGSGPAGVSCAWPLVEAGLKVKLVDPGVPANAVALDRPSLSDVRGGLNRRFLLGDDLRALQPASHASPKLRLGASPDFVAGYTKAHRIETENFTLAGTLATGGLSNVWGSVASAFDAADLAGMPITQDDLMPSYRAVAARIGLSGTRDDDMGAFHGDVPLQPPIEIGRRAASLLERYRERGSGGTGLRLGLSRNAVLSQDLGDRGACTRDAFCMWGCSRKSIYNAAHELPTLQARPNFTYAPGCIVRRIERIEGGYRVSGDAVSHTARRVVLAAGTVASTRLVLPLLGLTSRRLLNNPSYVFVLLLPGFLGRATEARDFAMAQLSYELPLQSGYTTGLLYSATGVSPADMAEQMPLTLRGGLSMTRLLSPALVLGLGYFDGDHSRNSIAVAANGVKIEGGSQESLPTAMTRTRRALSRTFSRLGAVLLPGSTRLLPPGNDSHYAGTLGMGDLLSAACEVKGWDGLYVVDGAAFGRLPAKHLTFGIMANADRIGRHIAYMEQRGG
jgi:choline dehydrogenase-like flavoprotein